MNLNTHIVDKIIQEKIPCFFISPHLDDAMLSAGDLMIHLSRHTRVEAINVFTTASPRPYTLSAKAFLKQCGYTDADVLFKDRVEEDRKIFTKLQIMPRYLGFVDASWRKIPGMNIARRAASHIFAEVAHVYPVFRFHIGKKAAVSKYDTELMESIAAKIQQIVSKYEKYYIFCPVAVLSHLDHVLVREVCLEHFKNVIMWSDFPYNVRNDVTPQKVSRIANVSFTWKQHIEKKKLMITEYVSQFEALFPNKIVNLPSEVYYQALS